MKRLHRLLSLLASLLQVLSKCNQSSQAGMGLDRTAQPTH